MSGTSFSHSKEYMDFLKRHTEERKNIFYEKCCNFSEKILPISPWKELDKKYRNAINFSHLKITPRGAFSFSILTSFLVFFVPLILSVMFGMMSLGIVVVIIIFSALAFYYIYDYPFHYSIIFRIKASEEMVLSIVYMSIAMRISPNLENAIKFAAENLRGPLAEDLRQLLWDVYTRRYDSISAALDNFIVKWKVENEEFAQALYLIKNSVSDVKEKQESSLNEAVNIMLDGSRERMKNYAQELKSPVTVLNALGIVLPIIGLIFLPMIGIFLAELEVFRPIFIILGYNILLPFLVYWLMKTSLEKRPYSFHQPDIQQHPKFSKEKLFSKSFFISILILILTCTFSIYQFTTTKGPFTFNLVVSSLVMLMGIAGSISFYLIHTTYKKLGVREEIIQIENEFTEALFQLGKQLQRGIPIEKALENVSSSIKDLKISKMFETILYNIRTFGMTLEQAIFDKEYGAIRHYPSKTVDAIMKAIVDISKRGMNVMAESMISISNYLKDVHIVEEDLKEMLSEVTSTMQIQALLLAPFTSGVVVALSATIMDIIIKFGKMVEDAQKELMGSGPIGLAGGLTLNSIIKIDKMMPVHIFQLIVGIYMIEIVAMLAIFLTKIKFGEESIIKKFNTGKMILMSIAIYIVIVIVLYTTISGIVDVVFKGV